MMDMMAAGAFERIAGEEEQASGGADLRPLIVGIGAGSTPMSTTEQALALALGEAQAVGARTRIFGGEHLRRLPHYLVPGCTTLPEACDFIDAIRQADGVIIASPGYHGSVSGLVKNAIDYIEETSRDTRPYLTDLPVGLITAAGGSQAAASTLVALRTIVHALRGWPTPFGATIQTPGVIFDEGRCTDAAVTEQIKRVGAQVAAFAARRALGG